jgi:hypothetical protein
MGTNYYRIPTVEEVEARKAKLLTRIQELDLSPMSIERDFATLDHPDSAWDYHSPWSEFTFEISIHLGKRSGGWKFCWNFHKDKYYSNKEELLAFIRSGRVVDEYGEEWEPEKFIKMALDWGQPDGWVHDEAYEKKMQKETGRTLFWGPEYWDSIVDGLRVSTSTEFF